MYDVAILGAGPAGVNAAVYSARYKLKTLLISQNIGGFVGSAHIIENVPTIKPTNGAEVVKNYRHHIKNNNIDYQKDTIVEIVKETKDNQNYFKVITKENTYKAKFVIYALGTKKRMLNVPGENKYFGKGVHTCATCDAPFYMDKDVMVVGGNDSGAKTSLFLSEYVNSIILVEMQSNLPMEPLWKERIEKNDKIKVITNTTVKEIKGDEFVNEVVLNNNESHSVSGVFIEIGSDPILDIAKTAGVLADKFNYIDVDKTQMTNVDGFYAAGDLTNNSNYLRQIASAYAEGAVASNSIFKRVLNKK
ncbi:MAG: NAD(P)/FAD-dependent oxidoreductase [Nanoarchaeota archaeon]